MARHGKPPFRASVTVHFAQHELYPGAVDRVYIAFTNQIMRVPKPQRRRRGSGESLLHDAARGLDATILDNRPHEDGSWTLMAHFTQPAFLITEASRSSPRRVRASTYSAARAPTHCP
jgi:hypothetical protein